MNPNPVYDLSVRMQFSAAGLGANVGMAISAFRQLQTSIAGASGASATALDSFNRFAGVFMAGAGITGGALVGVSAIKSFTGAAAGMQDALTKLGLATHGSNAELAQFQQLAMQISSRTQFSASQVAQMAQTAATAGVNNPQQLQRVLPALVNAAEIDYRMRGISPQQSVQASVALAHMYGAFPSPGRQGTDVYTGKQESSAQAFSSLVDLFGRSQLVSGISPTQMVAALGRLNPAREAYGISPASMIAFASLGANVGLLSGGGGSSRLAAALNALAPALTRNAASSARNRDMEELMQLGGTTWGKVAAGGTNAIPQLLQAVMTARAHMTGPDSGALFQSLLQGAFRQSGAQALSVLATPQAMQRYAQIQGSLANPARYNPNDPRSSVLASTQVMQQTLNQTMTGQMTTLRTNLQNIAILIGQQMLPPLTSMVRTINQVVTGLVRFGEQHPALVRVAAQFALVATGIAAVVGPIMMAVGAIGMMTVAFGALNMAALPEIGIAVGIGAAIAALIVVFMNWNTIMAAVGTALGNFASLVRGVLVGALNLFIGGVDWINQHFPILGQIIMVALGPLGALITVFAHWQQIMQGLQPLFSALRGPLQEFQTFLENIGKAVQGLVTWMGQLLQQLGQMVSGPIHDVLQTVGGLAGAVGGAVGGAASAAGGAIQHVTVPGLPTAPHWQPVHATPHAPHTPPHTTHIHPGAVTVHVHPAPGMDEPSLAAHAARLTAEHLLAATDHQITHGSTQSHHTSNARLRVPRRVG